MYIFVYEDTSVTPSAATPLNAPRKRHRALGPKTKSETITTYTYLQLKCT